MSWYVYLTRDDRAAWVGPFYGTRGAMRAAALWSRDGWTARIFESTPDVLAAVRASAEAGFTVTP